MLFNQLIFISNHGYLLKQLLDLHLSLSKLSLIRLTKFSFLRDHLLYGLKFLREHFINRLVSLSNSLYLILFFDLQLVVILLEGLIRRFHLDQVIV